MVARGRDAARVRGALWDVVFSAAVGQLGSLRPVPAADAPVVALDLLVLGRLVLLEVDAILLVVHEGAVGPRDRLVRIEQVPAVQADRQAAGVGSDVAGRVALRQQVTTRLQRAAVGIDLAPLVTSPGLLTAGHQGRDGAVAGVIVEAAALAERLLSRPEVLRARIRLDLDARRQRAVRAAISLSFFEECKPDASDIMTTYHSSSPL